MAKNTWCEAVRERRDIIQILAEITEGPNVSTRKLERFQGTEDELLEQWELLKGVVAEYTDGGDQMAENCTCGSEKHRTFDGVTFDEMIARRQLKRLET